MPSKNTARMGGRRQSRQALGAPTALLFLCLDAEAGRLLDDPDPVKPKRFCKRGTYASSAVQKRAEIGTINAIALRERSLTSFAFDCRFHQISNVIVIKHQEIIRPPRRLQSYVIGTPYIAGHVSAERVSRAQAKVERVAHSPVPTPLTEL
jgi:hypothetical protein